MNNDFEYPTKDVWAEDDEWVVITHDDEKAPTEHGE